MKIKDKLKRVISGHRGMFLVVGFSSYLILVSLFFHLVQTQVQDLSADVGRVAAVTVGMDNERLAAQAGNDTEYSVDKQTGQLTFIKKFSGNLPVASSPGLLTTNKSVTRQFLREYGGFFGISNVEKDLVEVGSETDSLGMFHIWYDQYFDEIPVFGGQISVHLQPDKGVSSANGRILPSISVNTDPLVDEIAAINKAKEVWHSSLGDSAPQVVSAELNIFNENFLGSESDDIDELVWVIDLYKKDPIEHEIYFIDAHNGSLAYQLPGKKTIYRRVPDCSQGACLLDYSHGGYVYGRSEGEPSRGANPLYGYTDVDDSYNILGSMQDYLNSTFGRDGANDEGGLGDGIWSAQTNTDCYTYIDYVGQSCPNAFFDGFSVNFCKGLIANDTVGHEYGHGIVDFSVADGLTYSYESGALHEAYADIFGESLENYRTGSNDWEMGSDINIPGFPAPIRNLKDPASLDNDGIGRYPDRYNSGYFYCGTADGGGVHHNSTVVSHAAYLMSTGGDFNGCIFDGIGFDKTQQIFYRALTKYFISSTDFNASYDALNTACSDLYDDDDCNSVRAVLQAVELNLSGSCDTSGKETPSCRAWSADPKDLEPKIVATSGPGEPTKMQVYDRKGEKKGSEISSLFPASYKGGAGVVAIDTSNNGVKDQVAIFARQNGGPQVRVMGLKEDGSQILQGQMFVFDSKNRDGLSITAGDFDDDGFDDDIATCLTGETEPTVRVYKDVTGMDNWEKIGQFKAPFGNVGCNLGTFQYDDQADEILVGPYQGVASPTVYIYTVGGTLKKEFAAYGSGVVNGVMPSGIGGRIYTTPNNGTSHVNVFDRNGHRTNFWWVYARHVRGDFINVAGDIDADGVDEILTAPFGSNGPHILSFEPSGKRRVWPSFFAFNENLRNGVGIAVIENWHGKN